MQIRRIFVFLATIIFVAGAAPCQAENTPPDATSNKRFELSAMMNAKPQLSRTEVDPGAVGMGSYPMSQPQQQQPSPQQYQQMQQQGGINQLAAMAMQTRNAGVQTQAEPPQDDTPGAFLNEYNIDWSRWVGVVADRWFYVLRNSEYALGVQFVTARPALIQFTCYADGSIGNIMLKQTSGVAAYDRLQVASLMRAVPTPPFPPGTKRRSITLVQGWESHPRRNGESDFQPGSFGKDFPLERVRKWCAGL